MKNFFKAGLSTLTLLALSFTGLTARAAETEVMFGERYNVATGQDFDGVITLSGAATVVVAVTGDTGAMFNPMDITIEWVDYDGTATPKLFTYDLDAGVYHYKAAEVNEPSSYTFMMQEAGGGDTNAEPIVFDQLYSFTPGDSFNGTFTLDAAATVTVAVTGDVGSMLDPEEWIGFDEFDVSVSPKQFIYNLQPGTYRYFMEEFTEDSTYKFTLGEPQGGGGDETPDVPEGYEALAFGEAYTPDAVGAVMLYYTAPEKGTLTVRQLGSNDSFLFNFAPKYSDDFYYSLNTPMEASYTVNEDGSYDLSYGLEKGKTYYAVAKIHPSDAITGMTFTWEPVGATADLIELDTPYTVSYQSPVYTYIAEADGVLSVQWTSPRSGETAYDGSIAVGQQQFFFYSTPACDDASIVAPLSVEESKGGYRVTFKVTEGEMYFLHLASIWPFTFECSLDTEASVSAAVTMIAPTPGSAYDVPNFRNYWHMTLSPNRGEVAGVELTYVPANDPDNTETIELRGPFSMGDSDALQIPASDLVSRIEADEIALNTYVTFTLHGLTAGGSYVTEYTGDGAEYVEIGEDGEMTVSFLVGNAVTLEKSTFPDPFYQKFEAGDPKGVATLVFSDNLSSAGSVTVIQGHVTQGSQSGGDEPPASVEIPAKNVKYNGNAMTVDFSGIDMSSIPAGNATIMIKGVTGANGLYADYDGYSIYTYHFTMTAGAAPAPEFSMPEPRVIVPIGGVAQTLNNMVMVTWGYYGLVDNSGDNPIQATLEFPNGEQKTVKGSITDANGVETGDVTSMPAPEDNALMFRNFMNVDENTNQLIQMYGTYTLTIPEGVVLVNDEPNPMATLKFQIVGESGMGYATLLEPEKDYVSSCSEITLTWNMQEISLGDNVEGITVKVGSDTYTFEDLTVSLTDGTGTDDPGIGLFEGDGDGEGEGEDAVNNALVIELPAESVWEKTGVFEFYIPAEAVVNGAGEGNPEQYVRVNVLPLTEATFTVTPECENWGTATVASLEEVTLSWGKAVSLNEPSGVRLDLPDFTQIYLEDLGLLSINDADEVVLDIAEYTEQDGDYVIVVPQDAFIIGGIIDMALNDEICLTYTVTADDKVASFVEDNDGRYDVFSIDGVLVLSTTDAQALRGLAKGLYVINGKKVFVRK